MAMISHFLGLISVIVNELKSSIKKQRGWMGTKQDPNISCPQKTNKIVNTQAKTEKIFQANDNRVRLRLGLIRSYMLKFKLKTITRIKEQSRKNQFIRRFNNYKYTHFQHQSNQIDE
jgi:hypothetical protein